jgi:hypothetical protein
VIVISGFELIRERLLISGRDNYLWVNPCGFEKGIPSRGARS